MNLTGFCGALAMMVFSCAVPADSAKAKVETPAKWSIDFNTTGGFTGRGVGSVKISSDGAIVAGDFTRTCEGALTADERRHLGTLVSDAAREPWKDRYARPDNPYGAADQIDYMLTLDVDAVTKTAKWYEEVSSTLPPGLQALRTAAWSIRQRVIDACPAK